MPGRHVDHHAKEREREGRKAQKWVDDNAEFAFADTHFILTLAIEYERQLEEPGLHQHSAGHAAITRVLNRPHVYPNIRANLNRIGRDMRKEELRHILCAWFDYKGREVLESMIEAEEP